MKFVEVMFSQVSACPHGGGVGCLPLVPGGGLRHPGQTPWQTPPVQCMLGYGQQAGGMHPTGMHSCSV